MAHKTPVIPGFEVSGRYTGNKYHIHVHVGQSSSRWFKVYAKLDHDLDPLPPYSVIMIVWVPTPSKKMKGLVHFALPTCSTGTMGRQQRRLATHHDTSVHVTKLAFLHKLAT